MGSSDSKCNEIEHLPPEIEEKATKFFNMIDTNRSKTIDKEETLQFWKKNFPKLNTNELFSQVDKNNDGAIQYDEWIDFWLLVLRTGHSVESVSQEVR
jgi:Ca2+-binding EF-hand superfamily protein